MERMLPFIDSPFVGFAAFGGFFLLILVLTIWSLIWKGIALWHAARLGHQGWFIFFLIINTAGIGEIIYYIVVVKKQSPASKVGGAQ